MVQSFYQQMPEEQQSNLHPLVVENQSLSMSKIIGIFIAVIFAGVFTGFVLAQVTNTKSSKTPSTQQTTTSDSAKVVGMKDKSTFKDSAEGMLKDGGIEGEGNFHLERPGGESQNVYLTSATVDLSQYIGKKVKVWGQTINSQKAGWLMDVGLVEVE
jgi:hypothetical protein